MCGLKLQIDCSQVPLSLQLNNYNVKEAFPLHKKTWCWADHMLHIQDKHQSASQCFQLHRFKAGLDIYYSAWRNDTSWRDTLGRPDALLMNYRYSTCLLACQLNCWLRHVDQEYDSELFLACAGRCFVFVLSSWCNIPHAAVQRDSVSGKLLEQTWSFR